MTTEESLWAPLAARRVPAVPLLHVWTDGTYESLSWDQLLSSAMRFGAGLRARGVRPKDRVACILTNSAKALSAVLGTWFAGAVVLSLPTIPRGVALARYLSQIRRMIEQAEPHLLVVDDAYLRPLAAAQIGVDVLSIHSVDVARRLEPDLARPDDPVFVQYSSGTTGQPRGCVLSARAIARQMAMLDTGLKVDRHSDSVASWLPISHDMGLFGCLLWPAYWSGIPTVLSTPDRFLSHPPSWFEDCAEFGATLTAAPNFALELAARTARQLRRFPTTLRRIVAGGERLEPVTVARVRALFASAGVEREVITPAYGLAEAVLAVTMTTSAGPMIISLDREKFSAGVVHPVRSPTKDQQDSLTVAGAGLPLPGTHVAIRSSRDVGEVVVDSPSLADGYLDQPGVTQRRFTKRGLMTGDTGFLLEDELFVTGRLDDLMTVAGRNVYARDVEASLAGVPGIRAGGCAVVQLGLGRRSRIVALAEVTTLGASTRRVAERIVRTARAAGGVGITECIFVAPGELPKTPSGKIQHFRCREIIANEELQPIARVAS